MKDGKWESWDEPREILTTHINELAGRLGPRGHKKALTSGTRLVSEYMDESEHRMDLHGEEFPQTKEELLKDFEIYMLYLCRVKIM